MSPDLTSNTTFNLASPGCFTIAGFCRWSGLGRTKVYELIKCGELRPAKCGRRTLVPADEAQRWRDALSRDIASAKPQSGGTQFKSGAKA